MRFERSSRARRRPGLTPLIDVVFLLLVFFMLASRFDVEGALPLALSSAAPGPGTKEVLRIEIGAGGEATIDGEIASPERIRAAAAGAARADRPVRVRPDPEADLQSIVDVLAAVERSGVSNAALEQE